MNIIIIIYPYKYLLFSVHRLPLRALGAKYLGNATALRRRDSRVAYVDRYSKQMVTWIGKQMVTWIGKQMVTWIGTVSRWSRG